MICKLTEWLTIVNQLYFLFFGRSRNSIDGSADSTYEALFNEEGTNSSQTRDAIRQSVLKSFASVRVWLFDAPCEKSTDTRQRLNITMTTPSFRSQVRALRGALAVQLAEPTLFSGRALKGKNLEPMIHQITASLNTGEAVMPKSAFLMMVLAEIQKTGNKYDRTMRDELIVQQRGIDEDIVKTGYIITEAAAMDTFRSSLTVLQHKMHVEFEDSIGNFKGDNFQDVVRDTDAQIQVVMSGLIEQFQGIYRKKFFDWFRIMRFSIENEIDATLSELENSIRNGSIRMTKGQLNDELDQVLMSSMTRMTCNGLYEYSGTEIDDTREQISKTVSVRKDLINQLFQNFLEAVARELNEVVSNALQTLQSNIGNHVEKLKSKNSKGFSIALLQEVMKREQNDLFQSLIATSAGKAYESQLVETFLAATAAPLDSACSSVYETAKLAAFADAAARACADQTKTVNLLSSRINMFTGNKLNKEANRLMGGIITKAMSATSGWQCDKVEKQNFITHSMITSFAAKYLQGGLYD
jgi:hypothetical protein